MRIEQYFFTIKIKRTINLKWTEYLRQQMKTKSIRENLEFYN